MTAPGALIEVAAQSWSTAALNSAQHFQLLIAEPGAVRRDKAVPVNVK
jgi:hypothetical protein